MGRRKIPDDKKKKLMTISLDQDVIQVALSHHNASQWINETLKTAIKNKKFGRKQPAEESPKEKDPVSTNG